MIKKSQIWTYCEESTQTYVKRDNIYKIRRRELNIVGSSCLFTVWAHWLLVSQAWRYIIRRFQNWSVERNIERNSRSAAPAWNPMHYYNCCMWKTFILLWIRLASLTKGQWGRKSGFCFQVIYFLGLISVIEMIINHI